MPTLANMLYSVNLRWYCSFATRKFEKGCPEPWFFMPALLFLKLTRKIGKCPQIIEKLKCMAYFNSGEERLVHWWKHLPSSNAPWVRFLLRDLSPYVGWVCYFRLSLNRILWLGWFALNHIVILSASESKNVGPQHPCESQNQRNVFWNIRAAWNYAIQITVKDVVAMNEWIPKSLQ